MKSGMCYSNWCLQLIKGISPHPPISVGKVSALTLFVIAPNQEVLELGRSINLNAPQRISYLPQSDKLS